MARNKKPEVFAESLWLAKNDIRRAWLSYPASGAFILAISIFTAPAVNGFLTMEGFGGSESRVEGAFEAFFPDYMFLVVTALLAVNAMSMDYMRVFSDDVFSHRLTFLRSLPTSTTSLVVSRMMSMLVALPFTVPAFFLPIYFFSELGELGFSFVWLVGVWLGWSLALAGVSLLGEFAANGKVYVWGSFIGVIALVVALALLEFTVELALVERSADLALTRGPLAAFASILLGGGIFALLARETKRRIERRELA